MTNSYSQGTFLGAMLSRTTLYVIMPLLFLVGVVLLVKPQILASRTKLKVPTVRTIAIILTVICVVYFAFVIFLSISFGQGPKAG